MALKNISLAIGVGSSLAFAEPEFGLTIYTTASIGTGDTDSVTAFHAHDPVDNASLQGIEFSLTGQFNEYIGLHTAYNGFLDSDDDFKGEFEEAYAKLSLFDELLTVKGGRLLNQFSSENHLHLHAWNFANSSLLTTRFGGEEGLLTNSIELSYKLPLKHDSFLSMSFGDAVPHNHGHEEEGEHEDELHGEDALFQDKIFNVSFNGKFLTNDYNHFLYRLHHSFGENGFGARDSSATGAKFEYQWRQNGQLVGGDFFSIGAEWLYRDIDYASEDGDKVGSVSEQGYALTTRYGFGDNWTAGIRYENVEGSNTLEDLPEISRISAALTKGIKLSDYLDTTLRLQYDHIEQDGAKDNDVLWFQVMMAFGAGSSE